jgi:hypothetical protein
LTVQQLSRQFGQLVDTPTPAISFPFPAAGWRKILRVAKKLQPNTPGAVYKKNHSS